MLTAQSIAFSYNRQTVFSYPDIYCSVEEPLLLTGKSGTGKTTLLHLLSGILQPQGGHIIIDGVDLSMLKKRRLDGFRGKNVGIVFQQSHFFASLSVIDNILLSRYFSGKTATRHDASNIAERLGISHLLKKLPSQLSLGEQQRVSIARALVNEPKVLYADEPTSSLDDGNCEKVIDLLKEQSALTGAALVIVTHDARLKEKFTNSIHLS